MIELYQGDCLDVLPTLEADSVDTCITDPPYGLEFMGKGWDYGVPGVPFWREVLRVLKPGAMLLAFGGTRTHHRLMVAIEDAGFEIRDAMMWLYGSGFPKSHDISKAIDKQAGAEREVVGNGQYASRRPRPTKETCNPEAEYRMGAGHALTAPATAPAQLWSGYGTALKPAWEIVIVAMKPRTDTFADNALEHGVAGLWVDGCRIALNGETWHRPIPNEPKPRSGRTYAADKWTETEFSKGANESGHPQGRWPANVILQHHESCERVGVKRVKGSGWYESPGVKSSGGIMNATDEIRDAAENPRADADGLELVATWNCHPDCAVRMLGEQSGERPAKRGQDASGTSIYGTSIKTANANTPDDTGTAARFFYQAKASKSERNQGLPDGMVNNHPTVKPVDLLRYLARLTKTPTGGVVLDPFMGSGSTGVAAILEGRGFIGIELDADPNVKALEIARHRCEWAEAEAKRARQLTLPLPPSPVDTPGEAR